MSQEHFEGKYEVEFKYQVPCKEAFRKVLKSITHEVMLEDNVEHDEYFDTANGLLKKENKSLCIRYMRPSGINLWIVKGPGSDQCEATRIENVENAKSMLRTLGYKSSLSIQKTRSIYFVGPFHITLDALGDLGHFAEFAMMTNDESLIPQYKRELVRLAAKFSLTESERQLKSYKEMIVSQQNLHPNSDVSPN